MPRPSFSLLKRARQISPMSLQQCSVKFPDDDSQQEAVLPTTKRLRGGGARQSTRRPALKRVLNKTAIGVDDWVFHLTGSPGPRIWSSTSLVSRTIAPTGGSSIVALLMNPPSQHHGTFWRRLQNQSSAVPLDRFHSWQPATSDQQFESSNAAQITACRREARLNLSSGVGD